MDTRQSEFLFSITTLRDRVTRQLILVLLVGFLAAFTVSLIRITIIGFHWLVIVHIGLALALLLGFIWRRRINSVILAIVILILMFSIFAAGIAAMGLTSVSFVLAPFISLYLMILGYRRLAVWSIAANVMLLTLFAFLFLTGVIALPFQPGQYLNSAVPWVMAGVGVTAVSVAFVLPFSVVTGALEGSEERFRLAFENANVGICITSPEGLLVRVNDAFCNMLGYSRDELEGMSFSEITHPDDVPASVGFVEGARTGGPERINFEKKYLRKDGGVVWANIASSTFKDPNDKKSYFITHIQDITARQKAEDDLRASEAHYKALVDNIPDILAVFDKEYRCLYVNSAVSAVSDLKPAQFVGKKMVEVGFSPGQSAFRESVMKRVFETRESYETYFEFNGTNGRRLFDWRVYPVVGSDGEVLSVFSFSRDITERKTAEDELRKSEERFHKIFHASPAPMSISTISDGRYIDVNAAFLQYMEYSRDEILGRTAVELGTWADENQRSQIVKSLIETGSVRGLEGKYRSKSGRIGTSIVSAETIELDGMQCIIGVTLDITERKEAEEALRESMDELHELTERLESIREDERKSISREVHDELGQVLTALQMDLMSLKRAGISDPSALDDKVKSMLELTANATKTVQNISARLRPGMLDDLGLVAAIEWQAEDFESRSGIRCILDLPDHDIVTDSRHSTTIFRILQEALTNVARHSNASIVNISLADTGKFLVLSVIDNGIGIEQVQLRNPKSYGLLGIRERLRPFNGNCIIQKGIRGGTEVVIRIPILIRGENS